MDPEQVEISGFEFLPLYQNSVFILPHCRILCASAICKMRLSCKNCAFEWSCMYFSDSKISYKLQVLIMTHSGVI